MLVAITDRDAARAIDEEIGVYFAGSTVGSRSRSSVIRLKIDRRIIKIVEKRNGGWARDALRYSVRRRRVAVDRSRNCLGPRRSRASRIGEGLRIRTSAS